MSAYKSINNLKPTSNIVITGATGFLGSSIAAAVLKQGGSVIAVTRNDPDGSRAKRAIIDASEGFNAKLNDGEVERIHTIEWEFKGRLTDFSPLEQCDNLLSDYTVWHSAAEMSYSNEQLENSITTNVGSTHSLYQFFNREESGCQRFYYISTAYTVGFDTDCAQEDLHFQPRVINAYQASKWSAELSLATAGNRNSVPVTIFRPSIIIGHEVTGWHGTNNFGFYGLLEAIKLASNFKRPFLELDIDGSSHPNFIPVSQVIRDVLTALNSKKHRKHLEVIHSVAQPGITVNQMGRICEDVFNIILAFKEPSTPLSKRVHRSISPNLPFMQKQWQFEQNVLPVLRGASYTPFKLSEQIFKNIIHGSQHTPEKGKAKILPETTNHTVSLRAVNHG